MHCADNCADHGGDGIGVVSDVDAHLDGGQGICISGGQNAEHTGNRFICAQTCADDVAELQHRVFPSKTLAGDGNGKLHPLFHTGNRDGLSVPGAFARAVEACVKYLRKACAGYGSADGRGNGAGRRKRGGIVMRWLAERDCVLDGAFRMAGIFQSGRENFHGRAVGGAGVVAGQNDGRLGNRLSENLFDGDAGAGPCKAEVLRVGRPVEQRVLRRLVADGAVWSLENFQRRKISQGKIVRDEAGRAACPKGSVAGREELVDIGTVAVQNHLRRHGFGRGAHRVADRGAIEAAEYTFVRIHCLPPLKTATV